MAIGKLIETIMRWAFAMIMAFVTFILTMGVLTLAALKLLGVPTGDAAPADVQTPSGPLATALLTGAVMMAPLAVASFVGAISVGARQRGVAAVLFPLLVFGSAVLMSLGGQKPGHLLASAVLEYAVSCALPGVLVYLLWRRSPR